MPTDPLRLAALASVAIAQIAPDSPTWQRDMERVIARAHLASWLAATSERLGVPVGSPLLSRARLSRAERAEIKGVVDRQLEYLRGFDREGMSEAAIAARMQLYSGATRETFYQARWGDWEIPDYLWPCRQACMTNCKCMVSVKDNGDGTGVLTREAHAEQHCAECPPLAGDYPVKRRRAA